jgi:hypothetical protein
VILSITNSCFTLSIQLTLVVFGESRLPVELLNAALPHFWKRFQAGVALFQIIDRKSE